MNIDPREIFRMYKDRCSIENFFDTSKNDLGGDATNLITDIHVMGYNFVTLLAFCIWWNIRFRLRAVDLEMRYTPTELLRSFAAMKVFYTLNGQLLSMIPKDIRSLADRMSYFLDLIHTS